MPANLTEVVTALSGTTVAAGGTFSFSARTSNTGNTSTGGGSTSRIFLSTDPAIEPLDTVLQIRTIPVLGALSEFAQNYTVVLPLNLAAGTYYIGGFADFNDQIGESNEGDNTFNRIAITVTPPANLTEVVTALTDTTVVAGGSFSFATNTVNTGQGAAAGSTARIYLSQDQIITAQDTLLATHVAPSLNAGQGNAQNFAVNLPANLAPGTYYIGGLADYFGQVGEANEGDNNGNVVTITVPPSAPDLRAVVTATGSTTVSPGGFFGYTLITVNEGNAAAAGSTTRLLLSTDPIITAQDTVLEIRPVGALAPGASSGERTRTLIELPGNLAPGTYYVGALADYENQIGESNEGNNNGNIVTITVTPPPAPDLRAVVTATGGTTFTPDSYFAYSLAVVNDGNAAAAGSTVRMFLSTDQIISAQDRLLEIIPIGPLAAGGGASGQSRAFTTLPADLAPGTYYIGAIADYENQIAELNEANNNGNIVTITITPTHFNEEQQQSTPPAMNASGLQLSQAVANSFVESSASLAEPTFLGGGAGATPDLIAPDVMKHA